MDGNVDATMNGLWFLTVMDSMRGKVVMEKRQVLLSGESLVFQRLSLGFLKALVNHAELNDMIVDSRIMALRMHLYVLCLLVVSVANEGAVEIILQKSVDVVGGGYSVLNLTNNVSQLNGNIMSGMVNLSLSPVLLSLSLRKAQTPTQSSTCSALTQTRTVVTEISHPAM